MTQSTIVAQVNLARAGATEDEALDAWWRDFRAATAILDACPDTALCGGIWIAQVTRTVGNEMISALRRAGLEIEP